MAPVYSFIEQASLSLCNDSEKYKLSLVPFTVNLLFGIMKGVKSISLLVTEVATSDEAKALGLVNASKSMYSEAFVRYDPQIFRTIFYHLVTSLSFMFVPELECLGRILLVDGSLFPAVATMQWASYQSTANAIKLHLAFDLNKMTPVHFLIKEANYSERRFLSDIIEQGVTYVCDRGYISFKMFSEICKAGAFFVIRGKNKMSYHISERLAVDIPHQFSMFLSKIQDIKVYFSNDKDPGIYRVIKFVAMGERYVLITNRFDLTTYQVIMLYAYRWQIELFFRFIKRTLNCIHLFSYDSNGIQVQFYLYMIAHVLLLAFKQECQRIEDEQQTVSQAVQPATTAKEENAHSTTATPNTGREYVRGLVTMLGKNLKKYWKINLHWLLVLRNRFLKSFNNSVALELSKFA